jgi:hypothetical protein
VEQARSLADLQRCRDGVPRSGDSRGAEEDDMSWKNGAVLASVGVLVGLCACGGGNLDRAGQVAGVVEAPAGQLSLLQPNVLVRFARLWVGVAHALTGIDPVPSVEVRLELIDANGDVAGELTHETTDAAGGYSFALASNEDPGSGLAVGVGSGDTLMRAFVYGGQVDITPASEATFRLVLGSGFPLGRFSADDLAAIQVEVDRATADVASGSSVATANARAEQAAADDPGVNAAIEAAGAS